MNDQWDFVFAAYAVTALGTMAVLLVSWRWMRRAEAAAADIGRNEGP